MRWTSEESQQLTSMWLSASNEEILQAFPLRKWHHILNRAHLLGLPQRVRERFSPVNSKFFASWSNEMAYVLGFWFADGWMSQPDRDASVGFISKDKDHLQMIRRVMQSDHTIHSHGENCFRLLIGSQRLWNDLYNLGGIPAKSLVVEMPFIPKEYLRHFIRGFVDGDGSLYWETSRGRKPAIKMTGGISFLEKLAQIIHEETDIGIAKVKVHSYQAPSIVYSAGIKAKVLAKWLYVDDDLALERKATLAQEFHVWEPSKYGWISPAVVRPRMQEILGGKIA